MNLFITLLWKAPALYIYWVIAVIFSICVHEFFHATIAGRLGDDTARLSGQLSMNPLQVMGLQALVCLFLFGIAWGAVPVNTYALRRKWYSSLISAAGPLSNLVLCVIFFALFLAGIKWLPASGLAEHYTDFMNTAAQANCLLFVFNMLPLPMLDGWGVLEPFVPSMRRMDAHSRGITNFVGILLLWLSPVALLFQRLCGAISGVILKLLNLIFG